MRIIGVNRNTNINAEASFRAKHSPKKISKAAAAANGIIHGDGTKFWALKTLKDVTKALDLVRIWLTAEVNKAALDTMRNSEHSIESLAAARFSIVITDPQEVARALKFFERTSLVEALPSARVKSLI